MAGLKPFRTIPKDIREWTRWMDAQDISASTTITADVNDSVVSGITLVNYAIKHSEATLEANAYTFNYDTAQSWLVDLAPATGNVTLTIQGGPTTRTYGEITIRVIQDSTTRTITWAGGTFKWAGGTAPVLTATNAAVDIFHFQTIDQGATWTGSAIQDVS